MRIYRNRKERSMLTVTPTAAAAVTAILERPDVPEGAGLRVQLGTDPAGERAIGLAVVAEPEPSDERLTAGREDDVFVDQELVDLLNDHVLDAEIEGSSVAFSIRPQSLDGHPG